MKIKVVKNILDANDQMAIENKRLFDEAGVITINIMASPGAGKTSLILKTIDLIGLPVAVVEGDIACARLHRQRPTLDRQIGSHSQACG